MTKMQIHRLPDREVKRLRHGVVHRWRLHWTGKGFAGRRELED